MFNWFNKKPDTTMQAVQADDTVSREYHASVVEAHKEQSSMLEKVGNAYKRERDAARRDADAVRHILREIVALETPGSAHIGRKMAALARTGLPEFAEREAA